MIHNKPNSITRDDFTENGLNLESIYKKIKQSVEDGEYTKTDFVGKLFPRGSQIMLDFYAKLKTLNLIGENKYAYQLKIRGLINILEKVVYVPSKDNTITKEDIRAGDLYSIHQKIINYMQDPDYKRNYRISKLELESVVVRREFYVYLKNLNMTKANPISQTTIMSLKNCLDKHFNNNE